MFYFIVIIIIIIISLHYHLYSLSLFQDVLFCVMCFIFCFILGRVFCCCCCLLFILGPWLVVFRTDSRLCAQGSFLVDSRGHIEYQGLNMQGKFPPHCSRASAPLIYIFKHLSCVWLLLLFNSFNTIWHV